MISDAEPLPCVSVCHLSVFFEKGLLRSSAVLGIALFV